MRKAITLFLFLLFAVILGSAQTKSNLPAQILTEHPLVYLNFNDVGPTYKDLITQQVWTASTTTTDHGLPAPIHRWSLNAGGQDSVASGGDDLTPQGGLLFTFSGGGTVGLGAGFNTGRWMLANTAGTGLFAATQPYTVSVWANANTYHNGNYQCMVIYDQIGGYNFCLTPGGGLVLTLYGNSGVINATAPDGSLDTGFHHMAFTYDGSGVGAGIKFYIDGALVTASVDTDGLAGGGMKTTTDPMHVGGKSGVEFFGNLFDLRMYNSALTGTQMGNIFSEGIDGPLTATPRVTGFDPSQMNNTSVKLRNVALTSPDGVTAPYDPTLPMAVYVHVNHLPKGGGVIASKDDSWILYYTGSAFCFESQKVGRGVEGKCAVATLYPGYGFDVVANYDPGHADFHDNYSIYVNGVLSTAMGGLGNTTEYPDWTLGGGGGNLHIGGCCQGSPGGLDGMEIDEFALFDHTMDDYFNQSIFVHTKFYLSLLASKPADPPDVIVSEDGCTDPDNIAALNMALKAHKLGYIKLRAVFDNDNTVNSHAFYRQILDSNGLAHIPVAIPNPLPGAPYSSNPTFLEGGGQCSATQIGPNLPTDWENAYNASTPRTYPDANPIFRKVLADLPTGKKLAFLSGGASSELYQLMQSPADDISSLTGQQLFDQKMLEVFFQGTGNLFGNDSTHRVESQYVLDHNGSVPLYFFDNGDFHTCCTPDVTGPGFGHTRLATDPLKLVVDAGWTGEMRSGWDTLPTLNFLTDAFRGTCVNETIALSSGFTVTQTGTPSNHWACPMTPAGYSGNGSSLFTWFVNSLGNTIAQGSPRGRTN